jgi:hypothetical protein
MVINSDGALLIPVDADMRDFADAFTKALYMPLIDHAYMSEEADGNIFDVSEWATWQVDTIESASPCLVSQRGSANLAPCHYHKLSGLACKRPKRKLKISQPR